MSIIEENLKNLNIILPPAPSPAAAVTWMTQGGRMAKRKKIALAGRYVCVYSILHYEILGIQ